MSKLVFDSYTANVQNGIGVKRQAMTIAIIHLKPWYTVSILDPHGITFDEIDQIAKYVKNINISDKLNSNPVYCEECIFLRDAHWQANCSCDALTILSEDAVMRVNSKRPRCTNVNERNNCPHFSSSKIITKDKKPLYLRLLKLLLNKKN